ncbi:MAG: Rrf2 family transcriptional regulator [Negativicutes bacterium]|nr:Rrf2 family transcriptional regulator [Negativicutes bacterium]
MALGISLSEAASLALHSVALIANAKPGELVNVRTISRATESSGAHLAKVMQRLARSGLLQSVRGPRGGFRLARPADQITLLEVCEVMDGTLDFSGCPGGKSTCPLIECLFTGFIEQAGRQFVEYLGKKSVADFVAECGKGKLSDGSAQNNKN